MWKIYKFQLLIMSPLLIVSLIVIVPIYYLYKFVDKIIIKHERQYFVLNKTQNNYFPVKFDLRYCKKAVVPSARLQNQSGYKNVN